jgi:hypothetical protein
MTSIKKVYIDSRHRTDISHTDSDFETQLNEPINLPESCTCVVTDVVVKNTIRTIEEINNRIYIRINNIDRIVYLTPRSYNIQSLAIELLDKIGTNVSGAEDAYNNVIWITPRTQNVTFRIFTDDELKFNTINWNGEWYDRNNLKSCNHILSHFRVSRTIAYNDRFVTGNINLQNLDYILLCSNGFAYSSYNARAGERNVLKI